MKTTKEFKKLDGVNGHRVFVSTVNSKGTVRVSVVSNHDARNKNEGDIVFQAEYPRFSAVPESDVSKVKDILGVVDADIDYAE